MMLAQGVLKKRHEVHIVTFPRSLLDNEKKEDFINLGAKVHELSRSKFSIVQKILQLRNLIRNLEVDVIHSHLFYADLVSALASRGFFTVCTLRSIPIEELTLRYGVLTGFLISFVHMWAAKQMKTRIACSQTVMRYYNSRGIETSLIHNAIPYSLEDYYKSRRAVVYKQRAREVLKVPENAPLLIMVGSLDDRKNPTFVIELFKKLLTFSPNAHFLIAGDGALKKNAHQQPKLIHKFDLRGLCQMSLLIMKPLI